MKNKDYLILSFGFMGLLIFGYFKYSISSGFCDVVAFESWRCNGHYFWPLWDFSRAMVAVGILAFFLPKVSKTLLFWTVIAAIGTTIAVMLAPSISSDFLVPIEKKSVGSILSVLYLVVSFGIVLWGNFYAKNKTAV